MVVGEALTCGERLRERGLFSLEKRWQREDVRAYGEVIVKTEPVSSQWCVGT